MGDEQCKVSPWDLDKDKKQKQRNACDDIRVHHGDICEIERQVARPFLKAVDANGSQRAAYQSIVKPDHLLMVLPSLKENTMSMKMGK